MKEIVNTEHLKLRLKVRKIPENYPDLVYKKPEQKYYDAVERTFISIKKLKYNNRIRNMMIAYEEKDNKTEIITMHPISDEKIINRVIRGRWIKHG